MESFLIPCWLQYTHSLNESIVLSKLRMPIALRLFLTVLLTTVVITTISLGVLHWTMQKNFTNYVADVEMQKLDYLNHNLADVYNEYHDWGNAIQAQILQLEGEPAPDDFDKLSHWWLKRQYDIALQQRYFEEHTILNSSGMAKLTDTSPALNQDELKLLEQNLPSEFQPFEGLKFPLSANQNLARVAQNQKVKPNNDGGKKQFISMPDGLGLSARLSLYDANKQFIVGALPNSQSFLQPILVKNKIVGYLGLKPVLDQKDASSINFFSNQKRYLILVYVFTIFISLMVSLALATYFKTPVQRLLRATKELTKGHYQYQVQINRNDELGDLAIQLNQLAKILDQHEKSRRQWVADTSHELKTPLAVLQAQIEAMQDGIRKPTPEHFTSMLNQVSSLKKLTQDLADLAQAEAMQLKCYLATVHPWQIVQQEVEHFKPKLEQANLSIQIEGEETELQLDSDRFKQIIANLLSNSIRYTEAGGKIHIHTIQTAQTWSMCIDDSPLGLSDEQLIHLGQRFYRVDDSRTRTTGGTGLGLALSVKLAEAMGGKISFDHSPLGGLRCKLTFNKSVNS